MSNIALYTDNEEYKGFLNWWEAHYCCPLPFADWFLDRGEEALAEAVKWAASAPLRGQFQFPTFYKFPMGLYPNSYETESKQYYWFLSEFQDYYANNLPLRLEFKSNSGGKLSIHNSIYEAFTFALNLYADYYTTTGQRLCW